MKKIVILKDSCFAIDPYLINSIAARWKNMGHEVIVSDLENENLPEADVAILHIDQTVVPDSFIDRLSEYPVVLNRNVLDISKSRISANILNQNDSYPGPVIIKTNANCGGVPEMKLKLYSQPNEVKKITVKLSWEETDVMDHKKYPILRSMENVPIGVWNNKNLIVEKFLPERKEDLFYLRYYMFLGSTEWASRFGAKEPIVKFSKMATEDKPISIPEELRSLRKEFGFDYGRFDYVIHKGKLVLFDVNKTIGGGSQALLEAYSTQLDNLADGIKEFL
jgi:hypothetical protein